MRAIRVVVPTLLAVAVLLSGAPTAAAVGPIWRREPGGRLAAVTIGTDRAVYVTGSIRGLKGEALMVARYRPGGGMVWRRTWRRPGPRWHGHGAVVAPGPDGGVYVGGYSGYGTGEGGDAILLRYSPAGRLLWQRSFPTTFGTSIVVGLAASATGAVVAVSDHGCCDVAVEQDGYVQAVRSDGSLSWRNAFEAPGIEARTRDSAWGVAVGNGGRVFVAGSIERRRYREGGPMPDWDRLIQALSPAGRVLWTRVTGRTGAGWTDHANDIAVRDGSVIAAGTSYSPRGRSTAWLGAFDIDGHRRWARIWGGREDRMANGVTIAPRGPIYVVTESSLRRYSREGVLAWDRPIAEGGPTGVAAAGSVYLTVNHELQRWSR